MIRIVTFGDSLTLGTREGVTEDETFSALLERALRVQGFAVEVLKRGIGGETTQGALARLDEIIALLPQYVTVMYGINDSTAPPGSDESPISLMQYRENLTAIVRRLRDAGIAPILMTPNRMSPFGITRSYYADHPPYNTHGINFLLLPFTEAMKQVGEAEHVPVLDIYAAFAAKADPVVDLEHYLTDGMHPNPAGHRIIAEMLLEYFLSVEISV